MFPVDGVRVERSPLGDKAGAWGGIALAMQSGAVTQVVDLPANLGCTIS